MKQGAAKNSSVVLSLAQLLAEQPAEPPPGWIEPGLLPPQGILFVGGEPKVGKSLLVANLRDQIMRATECSKRTAQLAIQEACLKGGIVQDDGQYRLPL